MDRGGTFLGQVRVPGGQGEAFNLGISLLEAGLAKLHPSFDAGRVSGGRELASAEAQARDARLKVCVRGGQRCCTPLCQPAWLCRHAASWLQPNKGLLWSSAMWWPEIRPGPCVCCAHVFTMVHAHCQLGVRHRRCLLGSACESALDHQTVHPGSGDALHFQSACRSGRAMRPLQMVMRMKAAQKGQQSLRKRLSL